MNISKETIALFRNFASINSSIMFQPGTRLATVAEGNVIMGEAIIQEEFPIAFSVYDLSEFLSAITLFPNVNLEFNDKFVVISDANSKTKTKIKYYGAADGIVRTPPSNVKFPDPEISFKLLGPQLDMIRKTSSVLKAPDLSVIGDGEQLILTVADKKNKTSNAYEVVIGEHDLEFKANIRIENLKMLAGDYTVDISSKRISRFKNDNIDLLYYVSIELDSQFK